MTQPSQVVVIVTVIGIDEKSQVFYTYSEPKKGTINVHDQFSVTFGVVPYHVLFALDYASTRAGWIFEPDIHNHVGTTKHKRADDMMSITTIDDDPLQTLRFSLGFRRRDTHPPLIIWDDPQEGNAHPPTDCDGDSAGGQRS
ncbi:hypothetical protein Jab_2c13980 [Janthinobacterium sp. HH01]|uniref:hypothetical protein n=1 Tax=Janthinobacterium sp. HH01 TaxID=1198452 RepID=UPI0002AEB6B0|nr:hypothetical protein [Janthinobacterium sp. HH01]ELX09332.1 hypothetical protein Jab_2c13980 [Janthinobacterium sp. HH01]